MAGSGHEADTEKGWWGLSGRTGHWVQSEPKGEPTEMGEKEKDGRKVNPGRQIMIICSVTLKAGVLPSAPWLWSVSVSHPETQ